MVEHGTENAGVDSSSLSLGTISTHILYFVANCSFQPSSFLHFADIFQVTLLA